MRLANVLREFLVDLKTQRLRTTLTVLGITWGTVAVVVLLAFGVGLERQTRKNSNGMGARVVILWGGRTTESFGGFPEGRYIRLREEDGRLLQREIPDVVQISPEYTNRSTPVRRGTATASPNITGVYPVYGDMRNIIPAVGGRFLSDRDQAERRRVAVLGDEIATLLFGDDDPVGERIFLGEVPFTVVGVMEPKQQSSSYNGRDKDRLFIPASTHSAIFGDVVVGNFVYRTSGPAVREAVEREVYRVLGRRYTFDPTDEDALWIWDTSEYEQMFDYIFLGFHIFFGIVGSFTLTVGGIGVANIMYIVVKERTREIGIKRSVGARRRDILFQFFAETFMIVGLGALLGFLTSWTVIWLSGFIPMQEYIGAPTMSPAVISTTLLLLAGIAFLSGLLPARKAANLDPVDCLRY